MADDLFDPDELAAALKDAAVLEAKLDLAERAADYWKSIAPEDTGEYQESIHVVHEGDTVAVVCDSPIAHIIEYGSIDTPEFACRARTEAHFNEAA